MTDFSHRLGIRIIKETNLFFFEWKKITPNNGDLFLLWIQNNNNKKKQASNKYFLLRFICRFLSQQSTPKITMVSGPHIWCIKRASERDISKTILNTFSFAVSDIQCSFSSQGSSTVDSITARLKKPAGFKGAPLFADDRKVNPDTDRTCMIRKDANDPDEITYTLKILDFLRCGVLKRNVCDYELSAIFY